MMGLLFYAAMLAIYPLIVVLRFMFAPISWLEPTTSRVHTYGDFPLLRLNWKYERNISRLDRKIVFCDRSVFAAFVPG